MNEIMRAITRFDLCPRVMEAAFYNEPSLRDLGRGFKFGSLTEVDA